jgi:ornithine decarboxylase
VKANPSKCVLEQLNKLGSSFELASAAELEILKECNVSSDKVLFGSAAKIPRHVEFFAKNHVQFYAADSVEELKNIARNAPHSSVYIRLLVNDRSNSVYHLSEKFGAPLDNFLDLAKCAMRLGLNVVGISFNVGSQALNPAAWSNGIRDVSQIIVAAQQEGILIQYINIGGGFPVNHHQSMKYPHINEIADNVNVARAELPYPIKLIVEPGRWLVADSFSAVTQIYAIKSRGGVKWAFVDMGVYSGLFEALSCQGSIRYDIVNITSKECEKEYFVIAGPTCDDLDIIDHKALLPRDTKQGDLILIKNVGAYSIPLTTQFNGFPAPQIVLEN